METVCEYTDRIQMDQSRVQWKDL